MRISALIVALGLLLAGCGYSTHPGAVVWGTLNATAYEEHGKPAIVSLAPRGSETAQDPEIEDQLSLSLGRRNIGVAPDQPFVLRYLLHTVPVDAERGGLGVLIGGVVGSGSAGDDVGVGFDLPLLFGDREVRHTAFLLELSLERSDGGELLWRGSAEGRSRVSAPSAILRPVVPSILNWMGSDVNEKPFTR